MTLSPAIEALLKQTKGVTEHKGNLRVQFKVPERSSPIKRSLAIPVTKANINFAQITLGNIKQDIVNGLYKLDPDAFWTKHFPTNSINYCPNITVAVCFEEYIAESANILTDSTREKLASAKSWLNRHKLLLRPISEITTDVLNKARQQTVTECKDSTVKEYTNTFSKVLTHALGKKYIKSNPTQSLKKLVKDDINLDDEDSLVLPFSQKELCRLISVIHIPQTKRMVELLAWTGMRHGELKALAWEDIDFEKRIIRVKYNLTRQGNLKPPKTFAGHREIELLPKAMEVLIEQKEQTFNSAARNETIYYKNQKSKTIKRRRVFLSRNNQPYIRPELSTTPKQWENWLIKAELAHRPAYQLRHTYASQLLMVGAEPSWLAKQMGHSDWGMIRKIYAKWIKAEKPDYVNELADKLNQTY